MFRLDGKIALITGAAGGLGDKIARTLHAQGATLALTDMREEPMLKLKEELGSNVEVFTANLTNPDDVKSLVEKVEAKLGRIDILVNNAGLTRDNLFIRMSDEDWQLVLDVNLSAGFKLAKAAVRGMMKRRYGPIISLNRIGKNGKIFKVYKMRTMYPYSEFLQEYIYKKNNLQEGGKFRHDIRVNTLGRFMRRYWIDELPMIANLLKGDMKLVGVRPLSKQYFNLYSPELQRKRIKYKPGLLPPFYADMPKTLDEIQASEMRYLDMCEEKGVFRTDCVYFGRILKSILFKHAHSN